jgi:hypothetical protein
MTTEERMDWWFNNCKPNRDVCDSVDEWPDYGKHTYFDAAKVPTHTREPYPLPTVKLSNRIVNDISEYTLDDIILENYQSHPTIKMPLSN